VYVWVSYDSWNKMLANLMETHCFFSLSVVGSGYLGELIVSYS
jgi:hypothetical protein